MILRNPFLLKGYLDPDHFCDRGKETTALIGAITNGRSVTLISLRRMGKTGLIHHAFSMLKQEYDCVYVDILPTSNLAEFATAFGKAVLNQLESPYEKSIKQLMGIFRKFTPNLVIDPMTGQPSFEINVKTDKESESTLEDIFNYLKKRKKRVVIAIDEFQQVAEYPEKRTEALLRSHIQMLNHVEFIFSGSRKHLLTQMFTQASRPFYQSTELLFMDRIDKVAYSTFVQKHFTKHQKKVKPDKLETIFEWTRLHTFYVQLFCHKLFMQPEKEMTHEVLLRTIQDILAENETYYYGYKNLLTEQQWNLLKAIAHEKSISKINQKDFLNKYDLSASSVQRSIKALEERELIVQEPEGYRVYDVFFGLWMSIRF
ncbi:MAG: hypothetical protein KF763_05585 [Cyclobacteriaceae bacterium]|nr:hypothetical protein [Cyclobacteriaceae bacterium]